MSGIIFEPWVGKKYAQNNHFGARILVLGESHYGEEFETQPNVTSEVVRLLAQTKRHSFFTKISKVLLGIDGTIWLDDKARGEIWEHVAFYNYIQGFVSTDPRVRPTSTMWASAQLPFLQVLRDIKPQVILVLGKELSSHLPEIPEGIEVCRIQHPSTGFVYSKWNPLFAKAVQNSRLQNA